MKIWAVAISLAGSGPLSCALAQEVQVSSPDSRIQATLNASPNGPLTYSLKFKKRNAIAPSNLGITVDNQNLGLNATFGAVVTSVFQETYPMFGAHTTATNSYRQALFPVTSGNLKWQLEVRVFNDGFAVRYRVPETGAHQIKGETSGWKLPEGSVVWYQTDTVSYEHAITEQLVEKVAVDTKIASPLTAKLPDGLGYAFMSEANLVNYSDMALQVQSPNTFGALFDKDPGGWTTQGEIVSPWRVTLLTDDLNGLVNSDMLRNLCPAPAPEMANAAWIKPGRSNWHWRVTGRPKLAAQNQWVDWTQRLGFEYYLIDDGWRDWRSEGKGQWENIRDVVDYATAHNVKIWAWVNSHEVFTPADRLAYFQKAREAGVVGLKIDFPEKPNVQWVNWYEDTLRDAAQFHLMIDFHGAVKPSGRERTWPHELTREAIFGRESGKLPALHDTALPFTRYVQGHADFTPTDFRLSKLDGSSWAHELAQAIVYTSPFLCYGGSPENYLQNPALELLKAIPSTWDETRVLPASEIGRTAAFARRKGNDWFIGVINGNDARPFRVRLDFLGKGTYKIDQMADSPFDNAAWARTQAKVSSKNVIDFDMRRNGGFVARITKLTP